MDTQSTDEQLAEMTQKGDRQAFNLLFGRYEAKILRYGQRFLYNYQDLEDAVQDVFIKAYTNINSFTVSRKFSTWLYRIAHNTFINVIKKKGREPISFFDFDVFMQLPKRDSKSLQSELFQKEDQVFMAEALTSLPPKYREPLVLFYFEEKEYQEIADIMRIPVSTVGVRLKRARAYLKKHIESLPTYVRAGTTQKV